MNAGSKRQFFGGAAALTFSTVLVKIIGMVYKIPLMRLLGAEGMGYFNSAYETYTLFFVISTAGIPVAISIMISEELAAGRLKNAEKIYRSSLWLLICIGTVGSLVMTFGSELLARAIGDGGSAYALSAVAPTVLFISISGAVRGYFQGCGNMIPTAVSQVVESLGKLVLGLAFAFLAKARGLDDKRAAALAILGLTVGTALSTLYLAFSKSRAKLTIEYMALENGCDDSRTSLSRLVGLAVPVTVGSLLVSLTRIVDMTAIMRLLPTSEHRLALYGAYSTMALPVYNLPSSLVAGIALALIPTITGAVRAKNAEREDQLITSGLKLCAFLALPASFGISIYSGQILGVIFPREAKAVELSAPLLAVLGLSVFASCLVLVLGAVLQANGRIWLPIVSMLAGLTVKLVAACLLIGNPKIGEIGAPVSTFLCNLTVVSLNFVFLDKYTGFRTRIHKIFFKPLAFSGLSAVVSVAVFALADRVTNSENTAFVVAAAFFGSVYLCLSVFGGAFDEGELEMIPVLRKIKFKHKKDVRI